ncbi:MAG TPA: hypothetical protein VKZ63_15635 [Kofleriaceae bacterium]|nr:hypothetical protein [Kofleriaceae bacterium]
MARGDAAARCLAIVLVAALACGGGGGADGDAGPPADELDCGELLTAWQTAVYQATLPFCGGDGECRAVGQVGGACEGAHLVGYDAVHRDTYDRSRGPEYQAALAARCRDHAAAWVASTPDLISRCRANRCELDYSGACP